ncbi:hypothetical protein CAC42_85 [Sphaceloma murrayae]|uniref:GCS light chain n=1 Tax=Sphaceloma murrayae TaxID=2082308 RepID=A0A2K1QN89_9PEZI|nr:hypothetical protein CAC42_85 [Sphaceloma murrayae]
MKIVLSTGNALGAAAASSRSPATQKSNLELVQSLRLNIEDAIRDSLPQANDSGPHTDLLRKKYDWKRWTSLQEEGKVLYVPAIDFSESSLQEEREQYDITVKLFFLRSTSPQERESQTREALDLVLKELHMPSVDLLIASFPGIYFDEETEDCPDKIKSRGAVEVQPESLEAQVQTWEVLQKLVDEGVVKKLGLSEFGAERLDLLLEKTRIPPAVDQINLRDCCSVPKTLLSLAKSKNVELFVHNDCTNVLPRGTVRELLGSGESGAGILAGDELPGEKRKSRDGEKVGGGISGEVVPQWVVKYTAVVSNRGVVENKGYFAVAELQS